MFAPKALGTGCFWLFSTIDLGGWILLGGGIGTSFSGLSLMDPQNSPNQKIHPNPRPHLLVAAYIKDGRKKLLLSACLSLPFLHWQ